MLGAMHRSWFAAIFLFGCPADDQGQESLESSSSSGSVTGTMTTAQATSTDSSGGTAGDTSTSTGSEPTTTTDPSTGADSSSGTAECEPGLEPAELTEVDGCEVVGESFCSEGQEHVPQDSEVEWMSDPPHSGPHYPTWELWGEHDSTVPRGNWVHNLEHGGIVLSYRCADPCEAELEILRDVIGQRPDLRVLLTPDPFLPGRERFAAISWTWIHRFDAPDLEELLCFADQHENHAPEDVP
jgi:hypothetical protein